MSETMPNITKVTLKDQARQINEQAQVLLAVQELEYHDKNFLTNPKHCCQQQKEYLRSIIRLSASMMEA